MGIRYHFLLFMHGRETMSSSINNIVGNNIRRVRMARSLTQTDLASCIGVNQRTISNWEKGIRDPGTDNIRSLADALEIAPTELIGHNSAPSDTKFQVIAQTKDMYPDIQINDTLTVSTTEKYKDGDIVIVEVGGRRICRKIYTHEGLISLLALDPSTGMGVYDDTEVKVIGRVIEIRRKL